MRWLFWRKRGWWHTPAGWVLGCTLAIPSAELAIPVSQYTAGAWAVTIDMIGLLIALAATIGFFVVKRHRWLLAAPLSFGLTFSVALALVEGWNTQVQTALTIARVVYVLGGFGLMVATFLIVGLGLWKMSHTNSNLTLTIGEKIANEGLFRDDGERIIVYAHRGRVLLRALTSLTILALFGAGGLWARARASAYVQIIIAVSLGVLVWFGGLTALLMLIRTAMTSPTLVVNADGIIDNGSMIVTGRGLLRWNETLGVTEGVYSNRGITYRYLDIDVVDRSAINRRQPLWKRALGTFASQRQSMGFRMQRAMLDRPPAELVKEIDHYINTHAPVGSWHKAVTDNEAEQPDEE